jgi:hypothetical protein
MRHRTVLASILILAMLTSTGCIAEFSMSVQGPFVGSRQYVIINNNMSLFLEADAEGVHYSPIGEAGDTLKVPLPYAFQTNTPTPHRVITVKAYRVVSGRRVFVGQDTREFTSYYGQGNQVWTVDYIRSVTQYGR